MGVILFDIFKASCGEFRKSMGMNVAMMRMLRRISGNTTNMDKKYVYM